MKHQMFVIYDSKARAYMQPWFLTQDGMAQRAFSDCVNADDHNFARHPEDYTLFNIGEFDDNDAIIKSHAPISMGNGIEYIKVELGDNDYELTQQTPEQITQQKTDGENR